MVVVVYGGGKPLGETGYRSLGLVVGVWRLRDVSFPFGGGVWEVIALGIDKFFMRNLGA